ncbi:NAD-dependent DNA ligase LigA [Buchnera aphidicola (Periphyllus koelreuteriae)]|uniref:NAD-dependent DNA ligase LigA n=1 Tax=Buchnera aphidicola TaxID=9 RepID=UPI0031B826D9
MCKIKKKIKDLQNIIIYYNYLYFILGKPIISDDRYDYLFNKLKFLENKYLKKININSPTQLVGSRIFQKSILKKHLTPMLSLNNVFNKIDFIKFYSKIIKYKNNNKNINFFCELKFDGIAVNLIYEYGVLKKAFTRGDGLIGEDVTKNIFFVQDVPYCLKGKHFPKIMEIRGEVLMSKKDFFKLNKKYLKFNNNVQFSSARNLASGTLRKKKINKLIKRKLFFICHGFELFNYFKNLDSYYKILMKIKNWGFNVNKNFIFSNSLNNIINFYLNIKNKRSKLKFDIDGIVIKVDSLKLRKKIGYVSKYPKWAIAFKFPSKQKTTKLLNVSFHVGRTGIITPVAHFKSVIISGAVIKKASIYNNNELKKLNLYVGDKLFISRAGDVIPKIIGKKNKQNYNILNKIKFPKKCPSCSYYLKISKDKINYYCTNSLLCIDQITKRLIHFFSKTSFKIKDLGPQVISQLVKKKNFRNPIDFFKLNLEILNSLHNVGKKTSKNILNSLNKFHTISLDKFIYSFGIKGVGQVSSMNLSKYFSSINNLINSTKQDFLKVPGIGKLIAKNLYIFFSKKKNKQIIYNLINKFKINILKNKKKYLNSIFLNKNILITGELKNFSRTEIKNKLEKLGSNVKNSFSKNIDLVIKGKNPGIKLIKSIQNNIKIIDENYLLKKLK